MHARSKIVGIVIAMTILSSAPSLAVEPFRYKEGKHGAGELKYVDGVPVLIVRGSPTAIGEQFGVLALRQVKPLFNFPYDYFVGECTHAILRKHPGWTRQSAWFNLELSAMKLAWPLVLKKAVDLEQNLPKAYREELRSMADAAGKDVVDPGLLIAANGLFDLGHVPQGELLRGCSSLIIPPNESATGGPLFGRNLDFYHFGYLHHYSLVTVYPSEERSGKRSFAAIGFPGLVGCFTGMNDAGLTIASHEVQSPNTTTTFNAKGAPFAVAYRRVLEECATVGEALKLLSTMEHASVTSLVIADTAGGAVIEVTPDALAIRRFKDRSGACTNHFCLMKSAKPPELFATQERYRALTDSVVRKKDGGFSVSDVHERMHAVRLTDQDKVEMTIQTFVFEPATNKMHLRLSKDGTSATAGPLATIDLKGLWRQ